MSADLRAGPPAATPGLPAWFRWTALALLAISWCWLHARSPPNHLQNNEGRMAAYVADIVHNGEWIYPRDAEGRLMSKPPAYAWLAALTARMTGRIDAFALYSPSVLSAGLIALLLGLAGRRYGGADAGFFAAYAWLASPALDWLLSTARYDGLFSLCVLAMALAALRAWETGQGWMWFWLAGAAATLVKGPLGIALGAAGLLAVAWERRADGRVPLRGSHVVGLCAFAALIGLWTFLAWRATGSAMMDRLVGDELVGHSIGLHDTSTVRAWHRPLGSWLGKLAPWSVVAVFAMVQAIRRPSSEPRTRRFERFFVLAIAAGLIVFTISSHRLSRMILPLIPFGALLAGPILGVWVRRWPPLRVALLLAFGAAVSLGEAGYDRLVKEPGRTPVRSTLAYQQLARQWREMAGADFPLTHVDPPIPFELTLQAVRPVASSAHALELLHGAEAAFVVVTRAAWQDAPMLQEHGPVRRLLEADGPDVPPVAVWGNRARPDWNEPVACLVGDLELHLESLVLVHAYFNHVVVRPRGPAGRLRVINRSAAPTPMHVVVEGRDGLGGARNLAPDETWQVDVLP